MRKIFGVVLIMAVAICSKAQFAWHPKWEKDKTETLDYTYSKHKSAGIGQAENDSVHATIEVKSLGENESFYFLQWTFKSYFEDTANTSASDKLLYQVVSQLTKYPLKVRIEKEDLSIKIQNRPQLDSVQEKVIEEFAAAQQTNTKGKDNNLMTGMMGVMVKLKIDDKLYSLVENYYAIYKMKDLKLNVKKDVNEEKDGKSNSLNNLFGKVDGYSMLSDTDPNQYKWHFETTIDLSKMMGNLSSMLTDKKDDKKKGSKKDKDKEVKTTNTAPPAPSVTRSDIAVNKADMLVTLYSSYSSVSMDLGGENTSELEQKVIKRVN